MQFIHKSFKGKYHMLYLPFPLKMFLCNAILIQVFISRVDHSHWQMGICSMHWHTDVMTGMVAQSSVRCRGKGGVVILDHSRITLNIQHGVGFLTFPKSLEVFTPASSSLPPSTPLLCPCVSTSQGGVQQLVKDKLCVVAEASDTASTTWGFSLQTEN